VMHRLVRSFGGFGPINSLLSWLRCPSTELAEAKEDDDGENLGAPDL
jgi:hypothetical protein